MSNHPDAWMQTATGGIWDMLSPTPDRVKWEDIASSLSKICRFNGHSLDFYSVAQHSVIVANALPREIQLYGLLHDAHEAFLGDVTQPLKRALRSPQGEMAGGMSAYDQLEHKTAEVIHTAAGLKYPRPDHIARAVKEADLQALAAEARDLMAPTPLSWGLPYPPLPGSITPLPPREARRLFLAHLMIMLEIHP